jgi:hypothetical protein
MERLDNPARLLHALLADGRGRPGGSPAQEVLYAMLGAQVAGQANAPLFHRRLARMLELPAEAEAAVRGLPDFDEPMDLRWLPQVREAFQTLGLQTAWQDCIRRVDDVAMFSLENCVRRLDRIGYGQLTLDIDSLKTKLDDLDQEVANSDLDERLRDFVREHLSLIRNSLDGHGVLGVQPIKEAVQVSIGAVFIDQRGREVQRTSLGRKFVNFLAVLGTALSVTGGVMKLIPIEDQSRPGIEARVEEAEEGPPRLRLDAPTGEAPVERPDAESTDTEPPDTEPT